MTPREKASQTMRDNHAAQRRDGQRLRQRRLEAGITQQAAANTLGIDLQVWVKWELGRRPYPACRLAAIASALGIPIASLLVDQVVLQEIRVSEETLERVRREGRPAIDEISARLAASVGALLHAEATRLPVDLSPGARAKPRRSREQVLASDLARLHAATRGAASRGHERVVAAA